VLDAVAAVVLELAACTTEPPSRMGAPTTKQQVVADPEPASRRAGNVAGREIQVIRTLEGGHVLVVPPDHVGRPRQQLEVLRR
jgi:hypothetical protein